MKNSIIRLILVATILTPLLTTAELLIYKGSETENIVGENNALRVNSRVFVIIDHDTANSASVAYATIGGTKRYTTSQHTNAHFVTVTGPGSKTYTVLAHIPNECDAQENPGKESVSLQGPNASVNVNTNSTIFFPKTLTDIGNGLSFSTSTGQPHLLAGKILLVFNQAQTMASNQAEETLEAALARLVAFVESLGYVR